MKNIAHPPRTPNPELESLTAQIRKLVAAGHLTPNVEPVPPLCDELARLKRLDANDAIRILVEDFGAEEVIKIAERWGVLFNQLPAERWPI